MLNCYLFYVLVVTLYIIQSFLLVVRFLCESNKKHYTESETFVCYQELQGISEDNKRCFWNIFDHVYEMIGFVFNASSTVAWNDISVTKSQGRGAAWPRLQVVSMSDLWC